MGIKDFFKRKKKISNDYSVEDNLLVLPRCESSLPHRCIYCNVPVEKLVVANVHQNETWVDCLFNSSGHSVMEFIFTYFLSFIEISFNKPVVVNLGICERHRNYRLMKKALGFLLIAINFGVIYKAVSAGSLIIGFLGVLFVILFFVYIFHAIPILTIERVESEFVYAKGCGKAFLDSLVNEKNEQTN